MNAEEELLVKWADGNMSTEERRRLSELYDVAELDRFIVDSGQVQLATSDASVEWTRLQERIRTKPEAGGFNLVYRLLPLLLLAGLGYWYWTSISPDKEVKNTTHKPMLIAMDDDTDIMLAPGSTIAYQESKYLDDRQIWLEGRAFFDVKRKGDFSVITDNSIVSVLGTSFDIWEISEQQVVVECFTGKVQVDGDNGNDAELTAGQRFSMLDGQVTSSDEEEPSWLAGTIIYDSVPLSDVYDDLEKYYPIKFVGESSSLNFNGKLPVDDINKVMKILNAVTSDTYKLTGDQVVVSKSE